MRRPAGANWPAFFHLAISIPEPINVVSSANGTNIQHGSPKLMEVTADLFLVFHRRYT